MMLSRRFRVEYAPSRIALGFDVERLCGCGGRSIVGCGNVANDSAFVAPAEHYAGFLAGRFHALVEWALSLQGRKHRLVLLFVAGVHGLSLRRNIQGISPTPVREGY